MELKINKDGNLEIKRKRNFRKVFCPFAVFQDENGHGTSKKYCYCGDWCSLFHEPIKKSISCVGGQKIFLKLCNTEYELEQSNFIDER